MEAHTRCSLLPVTWSDKALLIYRLLHVQVSVLQWLMSELGPGPEALGQSADLALFVLLKEIPAISVVWAMGSLAAHMQIHGAMKVS